MGVLLLVLFILRPSVGGLREQIANSISSALGRKVEISSASLRFLPQPGFDLENFIVYDDPAISLEPMVRSDGVTASLRIASLLRGRLEISRLSLTDPSLNLVRTTTGHWNVEYLVERAAQTTVAPTQKAANEKRPAFPYVEASGGRINFKFGMEKKQFALTEADFALFQDSENSWGVRLEAKPVRTDSNFSDTGLLKIAGSWQRSAALRDTPLRISVQWDKAQLGQASKLIFGNDKGWRGATSLSAELTGTPQNLAIITQGTVDDFRRYDILVANPIRLRTQCGANYSSDTETFSNVICESPVGGGALTMHGSLIVSRLPAFHLSVFAQDVPLQSVIALVRHAKREVPQDLLTAGTFNGTLKVERDAGSGRTAIAWAGAADTSEFRLVSQLAASQISVPKIHLAISSTDLAVRKSADRSRNHSTRDQESQGSSDGQTARVDISPFDVGLGESLPATVAGWFSRSGYSLTIAGDAQLKRVLRAGRVLGIPALQSDADGKVKLQLQIADNWAGFKAPRVTGSAKLNAVRATVLGLSEPLEIDSAELLLVPDRVSVQDLTASLGGTIWHGSLVLHRPCGAMGTCPIEMHLHSDEISTDELSKEFGSENTQAPWYRFLVASQKSPFLLAFRAIGEVSSDRLLVHKLAATHFSTSFELEAGKLHLTNMQAAVFGGTHSGDWILDFNAKPPSYSGSGSFQHVVLTQFASSMHDNWISGTASATYHAAGAGLSAPEIFSSATGILHVEARDGSMSHITLTNLPGQMIMRRFEGNLILQHKQFDFDDARLEANGNTYRVTGTASLGRVLNLTLARSGARGFNISGTVETPLVSARPTSETQAALKP